TMLNSLELFSGAGGLAKGIEIAGANHKAFVEWNPDACKTLRYNYSPDLIHETDVRKFDFKQFSGVDLIAGGPPCQPFSMGGKHKGFDDERDMFPYAISAIRQLTPKAFIFENVKGLLRKSFASYFNYIILQLTYPEVLKKTDNWNEHLSDLEKIHTKGNYRGLQYKVVFRLINAANYGVPQKRERVIIVGIRSDLNLSWCFPDETHSEDALLWRKYVTEEYWEKHGIEPSKSDLLSIDFEKKRLIDKHGFFPPSTKPWLTVRDAIKGLPNPQKVKNFHPEHCFRGGAKSYPGHTGSDIDQPAKALKAGDHGVPGGENMIRFTDGSVRYFTILEAKRIQTFPDDYPILGSWTEAMRQLGNAVPVRLGQTVAEALLPQLAVHLDVPMAIAV
ncbi:MAG: DNA (cytosine-5-)-methyltransferase, partial [Bacteroidota bacterium]